MKTVLEVFSENAARIPNQPCITDGHNALTYADVENISNNVALNLALRSENLCQTPNLIGVYCQRSVSLLPIILGIWKAGATYVPLNIGDPIERLQNISITYSLSLLISDAEDSFTSSLNCTGNVISPKEIIEQHSKGTTHLNPVLPTSLSYLIFTSGSTGTPKGVMISHQSLSATLTDIKETLSIPQKAVFLANTALTFDISLIELLLPVVSLGSVFLTRTNLFLSPFDLHDTITKFGITHLQATPSTLSCITGIGIDVPFGTTLLSGGEALPSHLAKELLEMGFDLYNMYGPTETTIWSSCFHVTSNTTSRNTIPIGQPLATETFHLVDPETKKPLTDSCHEGELAISGSGVAKGYLYDEDKTNRSFLKNVVTQQGTNHTYFTGDIVQKMDDGNFIYLSRKDNQVKIRGHRIELSEIENLSLKHAKVSQCCAVYKDEQLFLYYITHDGLCCEKELNKILTKSLPSAAVPSRYVLIDSIPLLTSGKIDRKNLQNMCKDAPEKAL
ncbi:AMP-binding protein [Vibrio mimicus]